MGNRCYQSSYACTSLETKESVGIGFHNIFFLPTLLIFVSSALVTAGRKLCRILNRIEDVITRYVNLPEHERGRLQNQEFLNRVLKKLKCDSELANHRASPRNIPNVKELEKEINTWRLQLADAESRLRCLEADPHMITSLQDAEYYERVLEESLIRVRAKKRYLEQTDLVSYGQANMHSQSNMHGQSNIQQMCMRVQNGNPGWNFLEHRNTDGFSSIRDTVAECMPTTIFPSLQQGSGNMHLGSHASDSNTSHLMFDYPPLEGTTSDEHIEHDMPGNGYGSAMTLSSQWQSTYGDSLLTPSSMVQNPYSLVQGLGMMDNVSSMISHQHQYEDSSQDDGIDAPYHSHIGDAPHLYRHFLP